jgi:hypothetical protein
MHRRDLEDLARVRLAEAGVPLEAGLPCGAFYLAGYAVEPQLKSLIASTFTAETIPDRRFVNELHTHRLSSLLSLAGLSAAFDDYRRHPQNLADRATVAGWSEQSRYSIVDEAAARDMIAASRGVHRWLTTFS